MGGPSSAAFAGCVGAGVLQCDELGRLFIVDMMFITVVALSIAFHKNNAICEAAERQSKNEISPGGR